MTYTKRQWFIYRLEQVLKLLNKVSLYMNDVLKYTKDSKYDKYIKKIDKQIDHIILRLVEFRLEVQ